MNSEIGFLLALGIGVVAGLRSMTAPAVVARAAHLGWTNLSGSPLAFMGSVWAVAIFTLGALAEFVADQHPVASSHGISRRIRQSLGVFIYSLLHMKTIAFSYITMPNMWFSPRNSVHVGYSLFLPTSGDVISSVSSTCRIAPSTVAEFQVQNKSGAVFFFRIQ